MLKSTIDGTSAVFVAASRDSHAEEREPHHAPKAKHIIMLYMSGGFSHVDTFDPKPRLIRDHDIAIGKEFEAGVSSQPKQDRFLKAPL
jgi:hypothetical protein